MDTMDMYGYLTVKKNNNEILPFVTTQMDLEGIMLSEMSEKDKQCIISLTCRIFKKGANKTKQKQSHRYNKYVVTRGERDPGMREISVGD